MCVIWVGNVPIVHTTEISSYFNLFLSLVVAGCAALKANEITNVWIEDFGNAQLAAEGAALGTWINQDLRAEANRKPQVKIQPLNTEENSL